MLEICFVNSKGDVNLYNAIQRYLRSDRIGPCWRRMSRNHASPGGSTTLKQSASVLTSAALKTLEFPQVRDSAFIFELDQAPHLFLPYQPTGTTGLARDSTQVNYIACRWDYDVTSKEMLRESGKRALVRGNGCKIGIPCRLGTT